MACLLHLLLFQYPTQVDTPSEPQSSGIRLVTFSEYNWSRDRQMSRFSSSGYLFDLFTFFL